MAQRTSGEPTTAGSDMARSCAFPADSLEPEKGHPFPARARHLRGDGAERTVVPTLILETVDQHLHGDRASTILPVQHRAGPRDAPVETRREGAARDRRCSIIASEEARRWQ